jgi:hypothetical protein
VAAGEKALGRADPRHHETGALEENLRTPEFSLTGAEVREIEEAVGRIRIAGDRYPPEEQRRISR